MGSVTMEGVGVGCEEHSEDEALRLKQQRPQCGAKDCTAAWLAFKRVVSGHAAVRTKLLELPTDPSPLPLCSLCRNSVNSVHTHAQLGRPWVACTIRAPPRIKVASCVKK